MRRPLFAALLLAATPAAADWETTQSDGFAMTSYDGGRYQARISCTRDGGLELNVLDSTGRGDEFQGVRGLMLWLTLPDGRTDRWPLDTWQEGPALSGKLAAGEVHLEFFRNGQSFRIDSPLTGTVFLEGGMRGTGAARLAFLERCGI